MSGDLSLFLSASKNSWKDILPMRATASREVSARAETNIVMMHSPHSCGRPSCAIRPVTPTENWVNGVAPSAIALRSALRTPLALRELNEPTTTMTSTASSDSSSMLPYPTCSMSFSLRICLLLVSLETSEWNPLTAPQAIVTNSVGNK